MPSSQARLRPGRRRSCACCRGPLQQPPTGRPRVYCSSACRQRAHHARASKAPAFGRQDWGTPADLWQQLQSEHDFGLDCAAHSQNALLPDWLGPDHPDPARRDALAYPDWAALVAPGKSAFLNPPFAFVGPWTMRCAATAAQGVPVVALVAVATSAAWWHDHVLDAGAEVRFIRGRLTFVGAPGPAPFSCALLRWSN